MSTEEAALNNQRFEGDQGGLKLATDALFNRGFRRYAVDLLSEAGERRGEMVWAKSREQIVQTFNRRGYLLVMAQEVAIGRFFAQSREGSHHWYKEFVWADEEGHRKSEVVKFHSVESAGDWVLWPEDDVAEDAREEQAG